MLIAFSLPVSAENVEVPEYSIRQYAYVEWDGGKTTLKEYNFNPNDSNVETTEQELGTVPANTTAYYVNTLLYDTVNGEPIFRKGSELDTTMYDVFFGSKTITSEGYTLHRYKVTRARLLIFYADKTAEYIEVEGFQSNETNNIDIFAYIPAEYSDIESFELQLWQELDKRSTAFTVNALMGEHNNAKFNLTVERASEESGLLASIIEWLEAIRDWIVTLAGKVTSILNSIEELPSMIWSFISEGLKNLFIPTDEGLTNIQARFDDLLQTKFGALYEVALLTMGVWEEIQLSDETNTIDLPETVIELPEDNSFTFGGFPVTIVPEGFEFMVDILKAVVGIVCSVMFINSLRKRYDEVMGVEQ